MRWISMMCAAATLAIVCTGCSSPFLPHNAVKYVPELARERYEEYTEEEPDLSAPQGGNDMKTEPLKQPQSYFSPSSIRERYAQHIEGETPQSPDPLLDVARDSIKLMRADNKSEEEIRGMLKEHYHFSDETIEALLNE